MIRAQDARGMVTAELAVTTLAAFALLTTMCWGMYLVVTQSAVSTPRPRSHVRQRVGTPPR